jgi:hypothetical protein
MAEAIIAAYRDDADLSAGLTGGLWFQQAAEENDSPYAVFYITGVVREELMGTADDNITEVDIQFNVFSSATDGGYEIADITDRVKACFDWTTIYPTGYRCVWVKPENILPVGLVDEIWQTTLNYNIGIQKE